MVGASFSIGPDDSAARAQRRALAASADKRAERDALAAQVFNLRQQIKQLTDEIRELESAAISEE